MKNYIKEVLEDIEDNCGYIEKISFHMQKELSFIEEEFAMKEDLYNNNNQKIAERYNQSYRGEFLNFESRLEIYDNKTYTISADDFEVIHKSILNMSRDLHILRAKLSYLEESCKENLPIIMKSNKILKLDKGEDK